MRKQNHSNLPEHQHHGRLNNSVVRSRKCKRPNALKHGVFSDAVLIPGEDSGQYKQFLAELMDEYKPTGPTLRDEVIELANLMWKRRRLRNFIQTKHIAGVFDPRSPAFMKPGVLSVSPTGYAPNQKPALSKTRTLTGCAPNQKPALSKTRTLTGYAKRALSKTRKNICFPIKSIICSKNFRDRITNQHRNGSKPSQMKSFQFC